MKNLYTLLSQNPSKLGYISEFDKYHIFSDEKDSCTILDSLAIYCNIYITFNEDVKKGDWCIFNGKLLQVKDFNVGVLPEYLNKYGNTLSTCYNVAIGDYICFSDSPLLKNIKIILTTNQDLIKDGVQAIDDEFLEWFVKNPNCEEVEVIKEGYKKNGMIDEATSYKYKIIIPKEEPKQETLEQAAEKWLNEDGFNVYNHYDTKPSFIAGAKWQQKRSYSEEEVLNIVTKLMSEIHNGNIIYGDYMIDFKLSPKQWFNQFKK